ncbi:unnamed protein product, partial [Didymodactylos carnosus]
MGQRGSKSTPPSAQQIESNLPNSVDYKVDSLRFSVHNALQLQQGIEHLNEHGYAVFGDVLASDEITANVDLLWNHLENLPLPYQIRRKDATTWDVAWPGIPRFGLMPNEGIGQSQFMWSVRGNPNVKKVFALIWQTSELLVSFDAAGTFRDWHLNHRWKTKSGWYHCDQHFSELQSLVSANDRHGNYVAIPSEHPLLKQLNARLVKCKAGDLVVWDSRCIHCNTPALDNNDKMGEKASSLTDAESPRLLRIVAYVCMSPTGMVTFDKLEEFRMARQKL